jgi:hypothetical protein
MGAEHVPTLFPDEFLEALGRWQNGWRESQPHRLELAANLVEKARPLPNWCKRVDTVCYRKRFLLKGELIPVCLADELLEGPTSWTTDRTFGEQFKGLMRHGTAFVALFGHRPKPSEVVVSLPALWGAPDFEKAVASYVERELPFAAALDGFRAKQSEVILEAPLRSSELVGLVGVSSPWDELFDQAEVPTDEPARSQLAKDLMSLGVYASEPRWLRDEAVQKVVQTVNRKFLERLAALASNQ